MLRFKLFPFVPLIASCASAIGEALAAPSAPSTVLGTGRFRRGVAVGLILTMLTPFAPAGHVHAEETEHEANDAPAIEAAAVQGGCPPYISGGPNNPDSGVRTFGACVDVPVPHTLGLISCEVCTCWYRMDDGRTEIFSTSSGCSSTIRIQGPAPDPCNTLNQC